MSDEQDVDVTTGPGTVTVTYQPRRSVTVGARVFLNVVSTATELVSVQELGILGPRGPQGLPGELITGAYEHHQDAPLLVWNIEHNLGTFPSVAIIDSNNDQVYGDIKYVNPNALTITFASTFSGVAYLV